MKRGSVIAAIFFVLLGAAFAFIALAVSGRSGRIAPWIEQPMLSWPLSAQGIMRGIFDVAGGIAGVLPIADVLQFSTMGGLYFYMAVAAACILIAMMIIKSSVSAVRKEREMAENSRRAKANKPKVAPDRSPIERPKPQMNADGRISLDQTGMQSQALGRGTMSAEEAQSSADEMSRLIQWEQITLDDEKIDIVVGTMYPEISEWKDRFHGGALRDMAIRMIAIARNELKLRDKGISPYQFSSFQNRVYQLEEEVVAKLFAPSDPSQLRRAADRDRAGMVVDMKTWRVWQQQMLVGKEEWKDISIKNALGLLQATQPKAEPKAEPPPEVEPPPPEADAE